MSFVLSGSLVRLTADFLRACGFWLGVRVKGFRQDEGLKVLGLGPMGFRSIVQGLGPVRSITGSGSTGLGVSGTIG